MSNTNNTNITLQNGNFQNNVTPLNAENLSVLLEGARQASATHSQVANMSQQLSAVEQTVRNNTQRLNTETSRIDANIATANTNIANNSDGILKLNNSTKNLASDISRLENDTLAKNELLTQKIGEMRQENEESYKATRQLHDASLQRVWTMFNKLVRIIGEPITVRETALLRSRHGQPITVRQVASAQQPRLTVFEVGMFGSKALNALASA